MRGMYLLSLHYILKNFIVLLLKIEKQINGESAFTKGHLGGQTILLSLWSFPGHLIFPPRWWLSLILWFEIITSRYYHTSCQDANFLLWTLLLWNNFLQIETFPPKAGISRWRKIRKLRGLRKVLSDRTHDPLPQSDSWSWLLTWLHLESARHPCEGPSWPGDWKWGPHLIW